MSPKTKSKKVEVEPEEDEEVDELDELEDLEDLADEDVPDDSDEEDEADEDEAPKRKSKKGKAKDKKKAKAESNGAIGSADLAEALSTDDHTVTGRELRVLLRNKKVKKDVNNRYSWPDVETALEQLGFDDVEEAHEALSEARNERLKELKARNDKAKKQKAKAKAQAEDDDSDEEDDEDEEDEKPKKKGKAKGKKKASKK